MDETYTLCPYCGERVDPADADVTYACEQVDVPGFGQTHDWVDGVGAFFSSWLFARGGRIRAARAADRTFVNLNDAVDAYKRPDPGRRPS
jgi:hypothetical protein